MQIKIVNIPLTDDGTMQAELNRVLSMHKVLEVEQRFFQNEKGGCWSFCIRYILSQDWNDGARLASSSTKIDYKQVLKEEEFVVFSTLREIRKQLAADDAVPAYAVFTDEELSKIAQMQELNAAKLISIKGIGDKKVEKYGKKLVELYHQKTESSSQAPT